MSYSGGGFDRKIYTGGGAGGDEFREVVCGGGAGGWGSG